MAENITSVLDKDEAGTLSFADVLYLIQGDGADRDRNVTLERIRDFFSLNFNNLKVDQTNFGITVGDGYLKVSTPGGKTYIGGSEVKFYDNAGAYKGKITKDGTALYGEVEVDHALFKEDGIDLFRSNKNTVAGAITFNLAGGISYEGYITFKNDVEVEGNATFGTGTDKTTVNGATVVTHNVTALNVTAGKIKSTGGMVLKRIALANLPTNPEDGETYVVDAGNGMALFVYEASISRWDTVMLNGVYPA